MSGGQWHPIMLPWMRAAYIATHARRVVVTKAASLGLTQCFDSMDGGPFVPVVLLDTPDVSTTAIGDALRVLPRVHPDAKQDQYTIDRLAEAKRQRKRMLAFSNPRLGKSWPRGKGK